MAADVLRHGLALHGDEGPTRNWVTIAGTTHLLRAVAACGFDAAKLRKQFELPPDDACARRIATATELFESERKRLALLWLPQHSVDEVAQRIGYASTPAFSRAFRRWTGRPPSAYRRIRR